MPDLPARLDSVMLEDHAGDVIRKARLMAGIPVADAAAAGALDPNQLEALEQSGTPPARIDWNGLARCLDLHPEKLEQLAHGWLPAPVKTADWREFRQITTQGEGMSVNCYLVWDAGARVAALFDTGFEGDPVFALIEKHQLQLEHLFITHTHGDHVAAIEPIRSRHPNLRLHTGSHSAPAQHRNRPGESFHIGSLQITHRDTPGHAIDGVTYLVDGFPDNAPALAVVGDAMFAGSIGGAPGKGAEARQHIRDKILSLPGPTLICPGHGPLTTVAEQKAANPFFR